MGPTSLAHYFCVASHPILSVFLIFLQMVHAKYAKRKPRRERGITVNSCASLQLGEDFCYTPTLLSVPN